MPDSKLSQLTAKDTPESADLLLITDTATGQSKKTTVGGVVGLVPAADTSVAGKVQMAQDADVSAGTNETKCVNPKQLKDGLNGKADASQLTALKIASDAVLSQLYR